MFLTSQHVGVWDRRTTPNIASGSFPPNSYGIELDLVDVAPAPVLPRLGGFHDRVAGRVEVLRGMPVPGGVTTTDVAADQAEPQMHPAVPRCQALLAALRFGRNRSDFL